MSLNAVLYLVLSIFNGLTSCWLLYLFYRYFHRRYDHDASENSAALRKCLVLFLSVMHQLYSFTFSLEIERSLTVAWTLKLLGVAVVLDIYGYLKGLKKKRKLC